MSTFRFGNMTLTCIDAGTYAIDGGAMFGTVPKFFWSKKVKADERNRIDLALRLLIIDSGQRRLLVDTGLGDRFTEGGKLLYNIRQPKDAVLGALVKAGIEPSTVTDVVITHPHFDHVGGLSLRNPDGVWVQSFPRATIHLQRRALVWGHHPSAKDCGSFHLHDIEVLNSSRLNLLDGPGEIVPGVRVEVYEGHTVAQQVLLLNGGEDGNLLYCADLIPTTAHLELTWNMAYDLYPLTTIEEKRNVLRTALEENWVLFFEHDPDHIGGRLRKINGAVELVKTIN